MAAFRSLRQLSVASSRSFHTRLVTQIPSPTFAAQVLRQTSAFSTSAKRAAEPTNQTSFVGKLEEEIRYEKENTLDSAFIKEFEEATDGIWKVSETPGTLDIKFTRQHKDETIVVTHTLTNNEDPNAFEEEAPEEDEEDEHNEPSPRVSVLITKSNTSGALIAEATVAQGSFLYDHLAYFEDVGLATKATAEADYTKSSLYLGPEYHTLDMSVQDEFEKFMRDRGLDSRFGTFVAEYADHKDQAEYTAWLKKVKSFVEA